MIPHNRHPMACASRINWGVSPASQELIFEHLAHWGDTGDKPQYDDGGGYFWRID